MGRGGDLDTTISRPWALCLFGFPRTQAAFAHQWKPFMGHRLFISHHHGYARQYHSLLDELGRVPHFLYENRSIPPDDPLHTSDKGKIKQAINLRIRYCTAVLVIGGLYTEKRWWILYEVEMVGRWNKPLVVVRQRKQPEVPEFLENLATCVVGWDGLFIVDTLESLRGRRRGLG